MISSLVAQRVKPLPTMRETQVQSLGQENLLEKEMATHSRVNKHSGAFYLGGKFQHFVGFHIWTFELGIFCHVFT